MRQQNSIFGNVDWVLILLYMLLCLLGIVNLYSAAYNDGHPSPFDLSQEYGKQVMWFGVCLGLGLIILIIDSSFWTGFAYHIYGVIILLLICVLLFGTEVNGAKSWFGVGSFGVQPSEFAKFGTALVLAKYLSTINIKLQDIKVKLNTIAFIGLPAVLIVLQPDAGTLLVFVSFVLVLYREGLSGNILLIGLAAAIASVMSLVMGKTSLDIFGFELKGVYVLSISIVLIGGIVAFLIYKFTYRRNRRRAFTYLIIGVLSSVVFINTVTFIFNSSLILPHQRDRIELLLGLKVDPAKSYNVDQSLSAIGSGRAFGKGYREGTLSNNKYKWVPMQSTDFIFCSVGEEWGFFGATVVIALLVTLLIRIIIIAERQRSKFTRIYGYSVASILFFHLLINVGMAIGLAPVIGIPLPFFSYGGSSLMGFTVLLFILIKLDSNRLEVLR